MEKVMDVQFKGEFKTCPQCGYEDGYHTAYKILDGKLTRLFICPDCHAVFNLTGLPPGI
jgi:transposase-like protein